MSRKNSKVKSRSSSVSDGDQSGPTLAEMREQEIQRKERDLQQKIRSEMQVEMMAGVEAKLNGMMEKFMERFAQASLSQQVNEPNRASAIPRAYPSASAFPSSSSSSMPSARHNDNADFGYQQFRAQGAAVSSDSNFEQGYDFEGNPIRVKMITITSTKVSRDVIIIITTLVEMAIFEQDRGGQETWEWHGRTQPKLFRSWFSRSQV